MRRFLGDNNANVSIVSSFGGGAASGGATTTFAEYDIATLGGLTVLQDTAPNFIAAQSFLATTNGTMEAIEVKLYRNVGTLTGQVHLGITTDSAGVPASVPPILVSFSVSSIPTDSIGNATLTSYNLTSSYSLTASTTYWFVIFATMTSAISKQVIAPVDTTNAYTGGTAKYSSNYGSSWVTPGSDMMFKIKGVS